MTLENQVSTRCVLINSILEAPHKLFCFPLLSFITYPAECDRRGGWRPSRLWRYLEKAPCNLYDVGVYEYVSVSVDE